MLEVLREFIGEFGVARVDGVLNEALGVSDMDALGLVEVDDLLRVGETVEQREFLVVCLLEELPGLVDCAARHGRNVVLEVRDERTPGIFDRMRAGAGGRQGVLGMAGSDGLAVGDDAVIDVHARARDLLGGRAVLAAPLVRERHDVTGDVPLMHGQLLVGDGHAHEASEVVVLAEQALHREDVARAVVPDPALGEVHGDIARHAAADRAEAEPPEHGVDGVRHLGGWGDDGLQPVDGPLLGREGLEALLH